MLVDNERVNKMIREIKKEANERWGSKLLQDFERNNVLVIG